MNVHAILELNTNKGIEYETKLLTELGIPPLKVLIGYFEGERNPSYLVDDVSEALDIAFEYDLKSIVILMDNSAMIVDVLTGAVLLRGNWVNVGGDEPDTIGWTYDQTTNSYYVIGE